MRNRGDDDHGWRPLCSEVGRTASAQGRRDNGSMNKKTPTLDLRLSEGAQWQIAPLAGDAPRRFSGIANSGRPFGYGSYQMVIDFDGIRLKDKTAVLIDHDGRQRAGVCTLSVVPDGLKADGVLLDNQHGQAVATESDAGFPWEMSVYVQSDRVEELSAGASVEVNGQTVTGPMMIMRGCAVREVSFTAVGVDAQTHAAALSGFATPIQPEKENTMSMTPEEKAEFDAMAAKLAALEAEKAELQQSKQKAETDAKLAAAGFKKGEDGKFSGLSDATYAVILAADPAALDAVIADIAPKPQEKATVPAALLSDGEGGKAPEEGGAKLSAATGESSLNKGARYV